MKISTVWFGDQFNVELASKEGVEPFISIKGCRIKEGSKGEFVSWPATKNERTGKWWNHVYSSEAFSVAVLDEAKKSMPKKTHGEQRKFKRDDADDDVPF